MQEVGVDMSTFTSDAMADFNSEVSFTSFVRNNTPNEFLPLSKDFDVVISCCGCGNKLQGPNEVWKERTTFEDWNLDDPPAIDPGDLSAYRRVRDELKEKVVELIEALK